MTELSEKDKEFYAGFEEAAQRYMKIVAGDPLTYQDVTVRFIIYASTLLDVFHYQAEDFVTLLALAAKSTIVTSTVPHTSGRKDN